MIAAEKQIDGSLAVQAPPKPSRYLLRCKRCKTVKAVDVPRAWRVVRRMWPNDHREPYEPKPFYTWSHLYVPRACPACGDDGGPYSTWWTADQVRGRYSAERRRDARCENARGPSCDCSCGGANHGRTHLIT